MTYKKSKFNKNSASYCSCGRFYCRAVAIGHFSLCTALTNTSVVWSLSVYWTRCLQNYWFSKCTKQLFRTGSTLYPPRLRSSASSYPSVSLFSCQHSLKPFGRLHVHTWNMKTPTQSHSSALLTALSSDTAERHIPMQRRGKRGRETRQNKWMNKKDMRGNVGLFAKIQ